MVRQTHEALAAIRQQITDITTRRTEAEKRADYLRHVVREIEDAKLVDSEDSRLEDEARVLENADELRTLTETVTALLTNDDERVFCHVSQQCSVALSQMQRIDANTSRLQELFDSGFYAIDELARAVNEYASIRGA